jgi:hypothetical protein
MLQLDCELFHPVSPTASESVVCVNAPPVKRHLFV